MARFRCAVEPSPRYLTLALGLTPGKRRCFRLQKIMRVKNGDLATLTIYEPSLSFLKSPDAALTLSRAKEIAGWGRARKDGKGHLVFAPAKYMSHKQLLEYAVEFAQLPFALYREA